MDVLRICREMLTLVGPSIFQYIAGSVGVTVHHQVYELARRTKVPGGIAVLTPLSAATSTSFRDYLHHLVAMDGRLTVIPFDPESSGHLSGLEDTARVQDGLGIVVGVPGTAVKGDVPKHLEARLEPVGTTMHFGTTGLPPNAYRLLPEALMANRRQLAKLAAAADQRPSVAKISQLATDGSRTAGDDGVAVGDLTPLAGVYYAMFGDLPELSLTELLATTSPLSRPRLDDALGLASAPMPMANILQEFESGRAAAALVHAPFDSPTPGSFWLVQDDAGQLRWATGGQPLAPVVLDGAVDPRTAVLEHPHSTFVVVDPDGVPYQPELPAEPTWTPRVSANARLSGNTILLGPDGPSAAINEIMAALDGHGGKILVVNVRRGPRTKHGSTLDKLAASELHHTLAANPEILVVVATEDNDELKFIVADQHGRASVQPTMVGFDRRWDVQGARSVHRERYPSLTDDALTRAVALADPTKAAPSARVAEFVTQPTWEAAREYLERFGAELRTEQVAQELRALEAADKANGERPYRYGLIKESPFYRENRVLSAFRVLIEQDLRARADQTLRGRAPLEPQNPWLAEPVAAHTQTADSTLFLGYLTGRPLDGARLGREVGPYETNLLWLRELLQAASSSAMTQVSIADVLAVVRAKGELEEERAKRTPGQAEIFRAHAAVVEAIANIVGAEETAVGWRDLLKATDCLSGPDRVAWHYIFKDIVVPAFPDHELVFKDMMNHIVICHDKAGA
ncbi:hypothetical protein MRQ36_01795 [Micromonospora sp. R77]|uniref:hypothetical protein n=1 Tax=Micromonospora sp. R77 TaxID=2925836 RepID=UPI001F619FE7|nr:hypothetical protein [Micromonospora sp. R77]MCI4061373.1 hypothetical protein [Micromonospora sp. R77]